MIFPNIPLNDWLKKYPIDIRIGECECGDICTTTIPVVIKGLVGLTSPTCKCGRQYSVSTYIHRDPRKAAEIRQMLFGD